MDLQKYWTTKHQKYLSEDWINRPTIFAKFSVKYFPVSGRVLELGAGHGQDSRYFAKLGYKVISTDFSDEALKISAEKAKNEHIFVGLKKIDISQTLPFKDGEFDVVYAHLSLHYFDHRTTQQLFTEISRVLKKDGILAALFNTIDDPEVTSGRKIDDEYYEVEGLAKRFFSLEYLEKSISGKFKRVVLDNKGETYKDMIKTLVRFIGKKV